MSYVTIQRDKIYEEIWIEPISKVCKKYMLSDNGLRKICIKLNIPIPDNSYWGKLKAGKNPTARKLPDYDGDNEYKVYINDWEIQRREQRKEDSLNGFSEEEKKKIIEICNNVKIRKSINNLHPLIEEIKQKSKDSRKNYYSPFIRTNNNLNSQDSSKVRNRKYLIYHSIFTTVENLGYTVKNDNDGFYFLILGEKVKISIREKSRVIYREKRENEYHWANADGKVRDLELTGILELNIDYYHAKKRVWTDSEKIKLEDIIGNIVLELLYCATKMRENRIASEEAHKRYMLEQERIYKIKQQKEKELEKLKELEEMADDLHRANKIRDLIEKYLKKDNLTNDEIQWINWAKDKADWLDPLINKQDDILDIDEKI